jgi:hypothetical protein
MWQTELQNVFINYDKQFKFNLVFKFSMEL